jgi:purine/pyrimidine-nucleoside phosphorylase
MTMIIQKSFGCLPDEDFSCRVPFEGDDMLKSNEYYAGSVKSIALTEAEGPATVGVMEKGEYEFGTGTIEEMTVITGKMRVRLPGADQWRDYGSGMTFTVAAGKKFNLVVEADCAYLCRYR